MPCRAVSCRRMQGDYLWITDDLLCAAWNRFARVSNANANVKRRRIEGRRYGSNVPGPLEAHRRLSKRRMGVSATTASTTPFGADMGPLFGFGLFGPQRKFDEWTYQAPGRDAQTEQQDSNWLFGARKKKVEAWESFLHVPDPLESDTGKDAVTESREGFERLLQSIKAMNITGGDLADVFQYLQTSSDHPDAQNMTLLSEWIATKDPSFDALQDYLALVLDKTKLRTLGPDDIARDLSFCILSKHSAGLESAIVAILDASLHWDSAPVIARSTTQAVLGDQLIEEPSVATGLWLRCLRQCEHMPGGSNLAWRAVYDALASKVPKPSALKGHLSTLRWVHLARVLIRHALPQLTKDDLHADDIRPTTHWTAFKRLNFRPHLMSFDKPAIENTSVREQLVKSFVKLHDDHKNIRHSKGLSAPNTLVCLLEAVGRRGLPTACLADEVFSILLVQSSAPTVYATFWHMHANGMVGVHDDLAIRLVNHFVAVEELDLAWAVFKRCPTVPVTQCPELPLSLARSGKCKSALIWSILQRQTSEDKVRLWDRLCDKQSLSADHVELIHNVASAYADCPHVSARVASRRVWECYLFLRDHGAPVKASMTRAMVTAGVTRLLREYRRISMIHFRYVTSIIAAVESRAVAEALNAAVWKIWSEQILPKLRAQTSSMTNESLTDISKQLASTGEAGNFRPGRRAAMTRPWLSWDEKQHREWKQHGKALHIRVGQLQKRAEPFLNTQGSTHAAKTPADVIPPDAIAYSPFVRETGGGDIDCDLTGVSQSGSMKLEASSAMLNEDRTGRLGYVPLSTNQSSTATLLSAPVPQLQHSLTDGLEEQERQDESMVIAGELKMDVDKIVELMHDPRQAYVASSAALNKQKPMHREVQSDLQNRPRTPHNESNRRVAVTPFVAPPLEDTTKDSDLSTDQPDTQPKMSDVVPKLPSDPSPKEKKKMRLHKLLREIDDLKKRQASGEKLEEAELLTISREKSARARNYALSSLSKYEKTTRYLLKLLHEIDDLKLRRAGGEKLKESQMLKIGREESLRKDLAAGEKLHLTSALSKDDGDKTKTINGLLKQLQEIDDLNLQRADGVKLNEGEILQIGKEDGLREYLYALGYHYGDYVLYPVG